MITFTSFSNLENHNNTSKEGTRQVILFTQAVPYIHSVVESPQAYRHVIVLSRD